MPYAFNLWPFHSAGAVGSHQAAGPSFSIPRRTSPPKRQPTSDRNCHATQLCCPSRGSLQQASRHASAVLWLRLLTRSQPTQDPAKMSDFQMHRSWLLLSWVPNIFGETVPLLVSSLLGEAVREGLLESSCRGSTIVLSLEPDKGQKNESPKHAAETMYATSRILDSLLVFGFTPPIWKGILPGNFFTLASFRVFMIPSAFDEDALPPPPFPPPSSPPPSKRWPSPPSVP